MGVKTVNFEGVQVGEEEVPAEFLQLKVNEGLIWEVIKAEQANKRQGTHKVKEKGEVRGGGSKPWRQKGTGRARQGSIRAPQWRGGGIVFGPRPRDYREALPRKKKNSGFKHILAAKFQSQSVVLLDELKMETPSSKTAFQGMVKVVENSPFFEAYSNGRKLRKNSNDNRRAVTFVYADDSIALKKSLRNLPWLKTLSAERLAATDLFYNSGLIITKEAMGKLQEKFAGKGA